MSRNCLYGPQKGSRNQSLESWFLGSCFMDHSTCCKRFYGPQKFLKETIPITPLIVNILQMCKESRQGSSRMKGSLILSSENQETHIFLTRCSMTHMFLYRPDMAICRRLFTILRGVFLVFSTLHKFKSQQCYN